jgi:hypothetical protein
MEPLKTLLSVECATINDVSVWEWAGSAYDEGVEAAEWFSTFLGVPNSTGALQQRCKPLFLPCLSITWNVLLDVRSSALLVENFDFTISFNRFRN